MLEGTPTQDMLIMFEMERSSMEEHDTLFAALSPQQTYTNIHNLRKLAFSLNPSLFTDLLWQVIVGGQVRNNLAS